MNNGTPNIYAKRMGPYYQVKITDTRSMNSHFLCGQIKNGSSALRVQVTHRGKRQNIICETDKNGYFRTEMFNSLWKLWEISPSNKTYTIKNRFSKIKDVSSFFWFHKSFQFNSTVSGFPFHIQLGILQIHPNAFVITGAINRSLIPKDTACNVWIFNKAVTVASRINNKHVFYKFATPVINTSAPLSQDNLAIEIGDEIFRPNEFYTCYNPFQ